VGKKQLPERDLYALYLISQLSDQDCQELLGLAACRRWPRQSKAEQPARRWWLSATITSLAALAGTAGAQAVIGVHPLDYIMIGLALGLGAGVVHGAFKLLVIGEQKTIVA